MIQALIAEVRTATDALSSVADEVHRQLTTLEAPGGQRLPTETPVPGTLTSITEARQRALAALGLVEGIVTAPEAKFLLVPRSGLKGLHTELSSLTAEYQKIASTLTSWQEAKAAITQIEPSTCVVTSAQGSLNVAAHFQQLENLVDTLLERAARLVGVMQPDRYDPFLGALRHADATLERINSAAAGAEKAAASAATESEKTTAHSATASESAAAASRSLEEATKASGAIQETRVKVDSLLSGIAETTARAEAVKVQVDGYEVKFREFDGKLTDRNALFESGKERQDTLVRNLGSSNETALSFINNAKVALGWATAEGLASSFSTSASELDTPLRRAQRAVYAAFIIVGVWAFVLFVGLPWYDPRFHVLVPPAGLTGAAIPVYMASALVIRLAILSPAVIFMVFSLSRYRSLYVAREQYVFKKTIAASLPGFKAEAASVASDEIVKGLTAAAYERLLFNPREAVTRDLEGGKRLGPLSRWIARLVSRALEQSGAAGGGPPGKA